MCVGGCATGSLGTELVFRFLSSSITIAESVSNSARTWHDNKSQSVHVAEQQCHLFVPGCFFVR